MKWLVYFDPCSAIVVEASTAQEAGFVARLQAWDLTGEWLPILRTEQA